MGTKSEPNCFGYAFWKLGLEQVEQYIDPPSRLELLAKLKQTKIEKNDAIAVAVVDYDRKYNHRELDSEPVSHIAVVDGSLPYISQRNFESGDIENGSIDDLFAFYIRHPDRYQIIYLSN